MKIQLNGLFFKKTNHKHTELKIIQANIIQSNIVTYALIVISNKIAAIGMMNNPSQNTGDVNNSVCIPVNTAAIGIDGQKLLKMEEKWVVVKMLS